MLALLFTVLVGATAGYCNEGSYLAVSSDAHPTLTRAQEYLDRMCPNYNIWVHPVTFEYHACQKPQMYCDACKQCLHCAAPIPIYSRRLSEL